MAGHAGSSKNAIPSILDTKTFFWSHLGAILIFKNQNELFESLAVWLQENLHLQQRLINVWDQQNLCSFLATVLGCLERQWAHIRVTDTNIKRAKEKLSECTLRGRSINSYLQKVRKVKGGFPHHGPDEVKTLILIWGTGKGREWASLSENRIKGNLPVSWWAPGDHLCGMPKEMQVRLQERL